MNRDAMPAPMVDLDAVTRLRRDGYVVISGVLTRAHVDACKEALSDLMQERVPRHSTNLYYEAGQQLDGLAPAERELKVRRLDSFCDDHPVLAAAAHSRRLHAVHSRLTTRRHRAACAGVARELFHPARTTLSPAGRCGADGAGRCGDFSRLDPALHR